MVKKIKKKSVRKSASINKFILKSQKRRTIRRVIILTIVVVVGTVIFAVKSDFFLIKKVAVLGNPIMSGEDVKKNTENVIGQNIFSINKNNIIKEAKKNPYVDNVEITKTYPKQINIKITEKQGVFYIEDSGYYYVLDGQSTLLEKTNNIENRNLVKIDGLNLKDIELGNKTVSDTRTLKILDIFEKIIKKNPTNYNISNINLSDYMNIEVYVGNIKGKLGNDENIPDKMNKLLHIIESPDVGITKGYVDVGFNGAPVYKIER